MKTNKRDDYIDFVLEQIQTHYNRKNNFRLLIAKHHHLIDKLTEKYSFVRKGALKQQNMKAWQTIYMFFFVVSKQQRMKFVNTEISFRIKWQGHWSRMLFSLFFPSIIKYTFLELLLDFLLDNTFFYKGDVLFHCCVFNKWKLGSHCSDWTEKNGLLNRNLSAVKN